VTLDDWIRLTSDVLAIESDLAAICGRIPAGAPLSEFQSMIRKLKNKGTSVWIDTSGIGLEEAVAVSPNGLKINASESHRIVKSKITDQKSALFVATELLEKQIENVVITLGNQGAVFAARDESWFSFPPNLNSISTVGSGDAFLAAFLQGVSQKLPYCEVVRMAVAAGAANTLSIGGGNFSMKDFENIIDEVEVKRIT
jgi:fructose-1-phosphate kinase PfkB-like protein